MTSTIDRAQAPDAPKKRDRTHWLYIAVIVAVVAGVGVGILAPDVGKSVGVLGTMFVALIKMMIAPVIFCTIVLGIGSVRKAASVGRVGGLALGYFVIMSTFALAIGLVVGNLIHPGTGLDIHTTYKAAAGGEAGGALGQDEGRDAAVARLRVGNGIDDDETGDDAVGAEVSLLVCGGIRGGAPVACAP